MNFACELLENNVYDVDVYYRNILSVSLKKRCAGAVQHIVAIGVLDASSDALYIITCANSLGRERAMESERPHAAEFSRAKNPFCCEHTDTRLSTIT